MIFLKQNIHKPIIIVGIISVIGNAFLIFFKSPIVFSNPWLIIVAGLDIYYLKKSKILVHNIYNEFKINKELNSLT